MGETRPVFRSATARSILLRMVPASLAVLLLVGYLLTSFARTELEQEARQRLSLLSLQIEISLEHEIDFIVNAANAMAGNEILIDSLIDSQSRTTYLPIFFASLRLPVAGESRVVFTDYKGRILAKTDPIDGDFQDAPWLRSVMIGEQVVQFGAHGMRVVVPVLYNDLVEGTLVIDLPGITMRNILVQEIGETANAVSYDGVVLASSDADFMTPGGDDRVAASAGWLLFQKNMTDYAGLRLAVGQKKVAAFAAVDKMINALFVVGGVLAISLIIGILTTLNSLTSPLSRLTAAVQGVRSAEDMKRKIKISGPEEFQILASAFNDMTSRLLRSASKRKYAEAANEAKSEFLSSMSHELRTPLNAILGFGQILEMDDENRLSKDQKESAHMILRGGQHLLDLINEVLDLSKIESGNFSLSMEPVQPGEVLGECLTLIGPMAKSEGITITVEPAVLSAPMVMADRTRFKQVLLNLLSNAVKYNRPHGAVTVSTEIGDGGMLLLSVKDTGVGIAEDVHDDVFNAFTRFSGNQTDVEGTGIGLTITKKLVEVMKGRIGFFSTVGEGSTFWVEIPLSVEKSPILESASFTRNEEREMLMSEDTAGRTVLYVEDNPANLKLIEMLVKRVPGVSLISAHNAEIGVVMVEEHKPDLILMDINLPGMSGIEALKKIRENPELADIPAAAISANAMPRDIEKGMDAGFMDYLVKPIQLDQVRALFARVLQSGDDAASS